MLTTIPKGQRGFITGLLSASDTVLARVQANANTYRAYQRGLAHFVRWYELQGFPPLTRALVYHYKAALEQGGVSASSINQQLAPVRRLAREMALAGVLADAVAVGIESVEGVRQEGQRRGNWLTKEQTEQLLSLPNRETIRGLRDRALLGFLAGAGLRREELTGLTFDRIQRREGRWSIMDITGKRGKLRSVPIATWTKFVLDDWADAAGISEGVILRRLVKGGRVTEFPINHRTVHTVVKLYATRMGMPDLAPHDLRRTYAKLARKGGAALEQIQLSLGHASVKTTEDYVGMDQDFTDAPADHLGVHIE